MSKQVLGRVAQSVGHLTRKSGRVRTDLEKSLKMTLVLENSWDSKKVQFVLELSLNFEKNSLIITKSP